MGFCLNGIQQFHPVNALDQIHFSHYLFDLVGLQMTDEVDGGTFVGIFALLLHQLLHPVLTAAVHTGSDCLTDGIGTVHLGGGAQLDLLGIPSGGDSRGGNPFFDGSYIFNNRHDVIPLI